MTDEEIQALQVELETARTELEGVKAEKETLASELETKTTAISEMEQVIASKDNDIATLKQGKVESDGIASEALQSLANAVSAYKTAVAQANPDVLDELISGDSIEAINQSVEHAQCFISRVKQGLEAEAARTRVPAGAPQRTPPDLSALSPREKIQYAIGGKR